MTALIPLRPSSAHIWMQCPAQPRMASNAPPEEPGDPAREGTCAAWVAEMVLSGAAADTKAMIGATHPNGWVVTEDMAGHVQPYVDLLRSYGGTIHVERKMRLNHLIAGTPDGFAVMADQGVLKVKDLKYGFEIVEPFQNPQVSIYAGAILRYLLARDVVIKQVEISIYQPRAYHPLGIDRVWKVNPTDLMDFVHSIEAAGEKCQDPMSPAKPGEYCYYCPAAATCPANAHEAYRLAEYVVAGKQRHMRPEELAKELEFLSVAEDIITGRKKAIFAEAEARVSRGEHVPGWHMRQDAGRRRWKVDPKVLVAMTGRDDLIQMEPVSPAEAERLGVNLDLIKAMTETPQLKPKLRKIPKGYYTQLFAQRK